MVQFVLRHNTAKQVKKRCCMFYYWHSTCLATNQVVARCKKLLQKVESSSTFCNKICTCCVFYLGPRQTCLAASDASYSWLWPDSHIILSNPFQKPVFTQLAAFFTCHKTGLNVGGKMHNIALQHIFAAMLQNKLHAFAAHVTVS